MARIAFIDVTVTVMFGGIQTAVWRLADALARHGHEIAIFGGVGDIRPSSLRPNIKVHTFPFRPREKVIDLGSRFQRIVERATHARHARHALPPAVTTGRSSPSRSIFTGRGFCQTIARRSSAS